MKIETGRARTCRRAGGHVVAAATSTSSPASRARSSRRSASTSCASTDKNGETPSTTTTTTTSTSNRAADAKSASVAQSSTSVPKPKPKPPRKPPESPTLRLVASQTRVCNVALTASTTRGGDAWTMATRSARASRRVVASAKEGTARSASGTPRRHRRRDDGHRRRTCLRLDAFLPSFVRGDQRCARGNGARDERGEAPEMFRRRRRRREGKKCRRLRGASVLVIDARVDSRRRKRRQGALNVASSPLRGHHLLARRLTPFAVKSRNLRDAAWTVVCLGAAVNARARGESEARSVAPSRTLEKAWAAPARTAFARAAAALSVSRIFDRARGFSSVARAGTLPLVWRRGSPPRARLEGRIRCRKTHPCSN